MSIDANALPSELLVTPQPLIGFCGLDVTQNPVHKNIWDAFNNNRKADRPAVLFKLLPANYEFPVAKPKRASYEWYHPKGILKRNWMLKHLHVLPAVVVLFQDMDWRDAQWTEKQVQCASILQSLKNALQERNTRLCLVLLQKAAPLPPGEDLLSAERAASLTTACGINSKVLFVLPHTEHILGYTLRLESEFVGMAQSYYTLMSKRIRTHRDQLTAAHTTLKIRHQFKLGFVAELRQDFSTALKHYTQSYTGLDEIRIIDACCLEIKTVAGFLTYKICRLMFKLKVPRDAINHFNNHIDKYKERIGFKDLEYEHYAWLSSQHSVFAELFGEAIKFGLPALQTQHPGIYYHKAAEYSMRRRETAQQAWAALLAATEAPTTSVNPQSSALALYTEFFGIRAVKTGDPAAEQQVNLQLCELEKTNNYSSSIISLLSQAMAQFKIFKCLRFRKKLAIDMAEEYLRNGDNANALTLYSLMLPDYRQEKWSTIFTEVLLKTMRCALLTASVTDFIACSVEALSLKHHGEQKERILVLENLWQVFQGLPPLPLGQIKPEMQQLWNNALSVVKSPVPVDLDKVTGVLDVCATFAKIELNNNEVIQVYLIARVLTDVPLRIRNFNAVLTDGKNNYKVEAGKYIAFRNLLELRAYHTANAQAQHSQGNTQYTNFETNLLFEPGHYYQLLCSTEAQQFHENTQLRILRSEAQMGTDKIAALLTRSAVYTRNAFRHHTRCRDLDDNMRLNPICYIAPTFHLSTQTNIDGDATMLVNEYFAVVTTISNPYNLYLQNVGINVSVPAQLRNSVFLTTDVVAGRQKLHNQIQIDIGELPMQSTNTVSYYIFSLVDTIVTLQQKLSYTVDIERRTNATALTVASVGVGTSTPTTADNSPDNVSGNNNNNNNNNNHNVRAIAKELATGGGQLAIQTPVQIEIIDETRLRKTREDTVSIKCGLDFMFHGRFYTLNKTPLTHVYRGENFLLRANTEIMAAHDVDVLDAYFICDHNLVQSNYSFKRKKFTNTYSAGDKLEDVIVLRTNATKTDWLSAKDLEQRSKTDETTHIFASRLRQYKINQNANGTKPTDTNSVLPGNQLNGGLTGISAYMNKSLMAKIPTSMTIVNNNSNTTSTAASTAMSVSNMSASTNSDDDKLAAQTANAEQPAPEDGAEKPAAPPVSNNTRLVFNKAIEAIQATGHCRGFIKGVYTAPESQQPAQETAPANAIFGIYCIRWRRHGAKEEHESKFVINGLEIIEPPLNIYCTIEEKMFVKIPMCFKVTLKNPTAKVTHLIATLSISNTDNFICSGHKQLDITLMAFDEKELVYNLYPLRVGWQNLPELNLEYNLVADPQKNESQNTLLGELVQRALPKRVFVLPPLKQQTK